nr:MAG TPA: hypothetical protein [Bacteriophage sp.]DAX37438.1 MAG TPA: hypothetical protein [Caudoviricetes sp.]
MKNKKQPKPLLCRFKTIISVWTNDKLNSFSRTVGFVFKTGDKRMQEEVKQTLIKSYKEMVETNKELRRKLNIQETSKVQIDISVKVLECDEIFEI